MRQNVKYLSIRKSKLNFKPQFYLKNSEFMTKYNYTFKYSISLNTTCTQMYINHYTQSFEFSREYLYSHNLEFLSLSVLMLNVLELNNYQLSTIVIKLTNITLG
jgi:hypothetical protein